jgi:hypothetical protein
VRQTLANHVLATIVLPTDRGKFLRIRKGMTPEPEHVELYRLLNVPPRYCASDHGLQLTGGAIK